MAGQRKLKRLFKMLGILRHEKKKNIMGGFRGNDTTFIKGNGENWTAVKVSSQSPSSF